MKRPSSKINVEKGEIVDIPGVTPYEVGGGTHASGKDTPIEAPMGTVVYSDKVKAPDGKTMAERKEEREMRAKKRKQVMDKFLKAEELFGKSDKATSNAKSRKLNILLEEAVRDEMEEAEDIARMEVANYSAESGEPEDYILGGLDPLMRLAGGIVGGPIGATAASVISNILGGSRKQKPVPGIPTLPTPPVTSIGNLVNDNVYDPAINVNMDGALDFQDQASMSGANDQFGSREGLLDNAGSLGIGIQALAPLASTIISRIGDRPHQNEFIDYAREQLGLNEQQLSAAAGTRDLGFEQTAADAATSQYGNRISARSQNLMRMLDSALSTQKYRKDQQINDRFSQEQARLMGERGQIMTNQDQVQAGERIRTRAAEDADRDAFTTALSTSGQEVGRGLQQYAAMNAGRALPPELQGLLDIMSMFKK